MWELDYKESWTLRNWCYWTDLLEKTLESPLDCKETQPVNPKGNNSWIFTGGLMLKLKLQHFDHLMRRADSFEKILMLKRLKVEGEGDNRGWGGWMASLTLWTWVWASSGSWWWIVKSGVLQSMVSQRVGHDWVTGLNWTVVLSCSVVLWDALWRGLHSENQGRTFSQQLSRKKNLSPASMKVWIISTIPGVSFKNNPSSWAWK